MGLENIDEQTLKEKIIKPNPDRLWYIAEGFRRGFSVDEINRLSHIDKWFLSQIKEIIDYELYLSTKDINTITDQELEKAKQWGFSDRELARLLKTTEEEIRKRRIEVSYKVVDTCAAEFEAFTPYYYSSYESLSGKVEDDNVITFRVSE
jgi:carbamoyl-phosphate synthase large subunit